MSATARMKNGNVIMWDPVPATGGAFTSIESFAGVYQQYAPELASHTMFANDSGKMVPISHDKMLKAAQKLIPDDSWYEEDFTNLRHPGR